MGAFLKNYSHIIVIGLICAAMWALNINNSQLTATNKRLERLADSKDDQIHQLRQENSEMADNIKSLVEAVQHQNDVMDEVEAKRAAAEQQNRTLQDDIKKYLEADRCAAAPVDHRAVERLRDAANAAAGGVPDNQRTAAQPAIQPDQPH